ncbi:MAG TPA: hypothetical protein VED41_07840, partial [Solirubrobacteraceae bacterium]|nr:hypothetical protein [Solirubrobacteraceae bacterium]
AYAREAPRTYAVAAQLPREDVLAAALPKGSENIEAVEPVLVLASSGPFRARAARAHLTKAAAVAGVDGTISTVLDRSVLHGALHTGLATEATLVLVAEPADLNEGERDTARALLADAPPVALVHGSASGIGAVRILTHTLDDTSSSLAAEMARRVARGPADRIEDGNGDWSALLAPEDVTFVSSADTRALLTPPQDLPGIVVTTLDRPSAQ